MNTGGVLKVALATPLMQLFDYLLPADGLPADALPADGSADSGRAIAQRGQRVLVPFGRGRRVGIVCALSDESEVPPDKLRRALSIIDAEPLFDESLMTLLEWAASYYHHPLGEVFSAALPAALRAGRAAATGGDTCWRLTTKASTEDTTALAKRAKVQAAILRSLRETETGATAAELETSGSTWRRAVAALEDKGLVERYTREREMPKISLPTATAPTLTDEQRTAVDAITAATGFTAFLLEGITGSGKTEVYLRCIEQQLETGRQTLVIVPEIGLTPQLVARFRSRLQTPVTVMHSGLNDTERLQAWCDAREGKAGVVIGTRSAVFVPLARPGLIVVDEEHDASLKQQEGFRYSARDLAVWRARQLDIPAILGSATPSLESIDNVEAKRYAHLLLPRRPGAARPPDIRLIDLRHQPARDGLTEPLRDAIARHLDANGQVLVYLNRRGFAPGLLCTACGELVECKRCDSRMVLHRQRERIVCHHCGAERPLPTACDACGEPELVAVGQGTERVEAALEALYPEHALVRIDRDTTRRRGEIERRLELVRSGEARILLGTQMLTKGHDFPNVTLVCILDADQGLFGTDFRAGERLAQSFVQVAGRAGRGEKPGEVYIQTLFPDHALLQKLISEGYGAFARAAMTERREAGWPPFACLTLLRAEATERATAFEFLAAARDLATAVIQATDAPAVRVFGPAPAPMERRAGRYRGQVLIAADNRRDMQRFLSAWRGGIDGLHNARRARWSIDVDPVELF